MLSVCLQILGRIILNGKILGSYYRKSTNRYVKYIFLYYNRKFNIEVAMRQYNPIANQILTLTEMPQRIQVMNSEP